jgi:hypothetical protein
MTAENEKFETIKTRSAKSGRVSYGEAVIVRESSRVSEYEVT